MKNTKTASIKKINTVVSNGMVRIEIPVSMLGKVLGYQKKRHDAKRILDEVRGMWRDRKDIDALEYQKNIRSEWG